MRSPRERPRGSAVGGGSRGAARILVVKLSALGDVLRTTSLLEPLHRRHPGAWVVWLTREDARPLLEGNPWIDEIRTVGGDTGWARPSSARGGRPAPATTWPPWARPSSARGGRPAPATTWPPWARRPFDLVLSMEEDWPMMRPDLWPGAAWVGVFRDAGGRVRYTEDSARYYDMSLLNRSADGSLARADRLKAANKLTYAELWLSVLGLPKPRHRRGLRPVLVLSERDRAAARALSRSAWLAGGAAPIGVNLGAGRRWPAKQLSVEAAGRLVRALADRCGRPIVILGGKDEASRNRAIAAAARKAGVPLVDPGTGQDLRTFAGLVDLCEAVVTTDSLALHIATALGKKTFVLVGPTSAAELDVYGLGEKIVPRPRCACFYRPRCRFVQSCLDRIPPERVARAVARWL